MSKKRSVRNAMDELDEHQDVMPSAVYMKMAKRLKVIFQQGRDDAANSETRFA